MEHRTARRLLVIVATSLGVLAAATAFTSPAGATAPQAVTIVTDWTSDPTTGYSATFAASGGVLDGVTGNNESTSLDFHGRVQPQAPRVERLSSEVLSRTGAGSFSYAIQGTCKVVSFDPFALACQGTWRIKTGTGAYERLHGGGTYTDKVTIDGTTGIATGQSILVGEAHVD